MSTWLMWIPGWVQIVALWMLPGLIPIIFLRGKSKFDWRRDAGAAALLVLIGPVYVPLFLIDKLNKRLKEFNGRAAAQRMEERELSEARKPYGDWSALGRDWKRFFVSLTGEVTESSETAKSVADWTEVRLLRETDRNDYIVFTKCVMLNRATGKPSELNPAQRRACSVFLSTNYYWQMEWSRAPRTLKALFENSEGRVP